MTSPSVDDHPRAMLDAVERDVAERDRLRALRDHVAASLDVVRQEAAAAREKHAVEAHDVVRLESLSPTRIWASLRGDQAERLDKERAEEQSARYAVGVADARVAAAERELAGVDARLDPLRDVDERRAHALLAVEEWVRVHGGAAAADLSAVAQEAARVHAERREVGEAAAAARTAAACLQEAYDQLRSAGNWADYDTFLGGGMLADMVKHSKLDTASDLMHRADLALRRLANELGDLGRAGVGGLGIDSLTATFDVWFDNFFSDWSVRNRIVEAGERIAMVAAAVRRVQADLANREATLAALADTLASQRVSLLRSS